MSRIGVVATVLLAALVASACGGDGAASKLSADGGPDGATCSDGRMNGDETDVDCGGGCPACPAGEDCNVDDDCLSGRCEDGRCIAADGGDTCTDGTRSGDETDVDCGGSCEACDIGRMCGSDSDCSSGFCDPEAGTCAEPPGSCGDGVRDAGEVCDGDDLPEEGCAAVGFTDGRLKCNDACELDVSQCEGERFRQVATGRGFSCVLRGDDTVACWGGPIESPEGTFRTIAADDYGCGIRTDGSLACWGRERLAVPSGSFVALDVGPTQACAIREDETLACWRYEPLWAPEGSFEQVAVGGWGHDYPPTPFGCGLHPNGALTCWEGESIVDAPLDDDFIHVTAGRELACGVHEDFTVECWGHRHLGTGTFLDLSTSDMREVHLATDKTHAHNGLGIGTSGELRVFGRFTTTGEAWLPLPSSDVEVAQLDHFFLDSTEYGAPHAAHGCALRPDDTLLCWGNNEWGQTTVPSFERYEQVSASRHGCGVRKDDGHLDCWGGAVSWNIGRREGAAEPPDGVFTQVAVGDHGQRAETVCGIREDGSVACWGNELSEPPPDAELEQIAVGRQHACGLLTNETVACWGANGSGESDAPRDEKFSEVRAAGNVSCGLTLDGRVECWGHEELTRTLEDAHYTQLSMTGAAPLVGPWRGCARREDGAAVCWAAADPAVVHPGPVEQVAAFGEGWCVRLDDGTVECEEDTPAPPSSMRFERLAREGATPCGLRPGGRIYCWGTARWGI